jgi:hypothetical protein
MSRTSDKHSPRRDDQLDHEEHALLHGAPDEGRTEPRRAEAPGYDEGGVGVRPEAEEPGHGGPPESEREAKAALAASFPPSLFPAPSSRLIEEARARFADDELLVQLERIPARVYETVGDVWTEVVRAKRTGTGDE